MIIHLIRYSLTLVILYYIFQETGLVTTLAFGIFFISLELLASWVRQVNSILHILGKILKEAPK